LDEAGVVKSKQHSPKDSIPIPTSSSQVPNHSTQLRQGCHPRRQKPPQTAATDAPVTFLLSGVRQPADHPLNECLEPGDSSKSTCLFQWGHSSALSQLKQLNF
jgi:hypothetical protein